MRCRIKTTVSKLLENRVLEKYKSFLYYRKYIIVLGLEKLCLRSKITFKPHIKFEVITEFNVSYLFAIFYLLSFICYTLSLNIKNSKY